LLELHFAPEESGKGVRSLLPERPSGCCAQKAPDPFSASQKALGPVAARDSMAAQKAVQAGAYDAALDFPADFAQRLTAYRRALEERMHSGGDHRAASEQVALAVPRPRIIFTTANERSQVAFARLSAVLERWTEEVGKTNLAAGGVPASAVRPFEVDSKDVSEETAYRGAAAWSKILPVLLLIWAMTGAFYPAVDLCAGEKERGTLETLLSSPAERSEIVLGKLLTVMLFSGATSALNLLSVAVTGCLIFGQVTAFSPPPPLAIVWLAVALLPMAALFSALCLALAAWARSSKEGQYYLMPLLLVTLPLAILPMTPGVELSLGNSLIPITGVVLILRSVLEGAYWPALQYLPVVLAVTLTACWLAVRWAVEQFNSESVLFRGSDRCGLGMWLRHLVRDRQPTPTLSCAVVCGIVILIAKFFLGAALTQPEGFDGFVRMVLVTQLAVIVAPAMLMTLLLTRSPRQTLLLRLPHRGALAAAALLALAIHPFAIAAQTVVQQLYPFSDEMQKAMEGLHGMLAAAPGWQIILVLAILPAVCEELVFRGFILSGFRQTGHTVRAIVLSAILFGLVHGILQQSIIACVLGLVLGFLAVRTGSILPGMLFHCLHNTLAVASSWITLATLDRWPVLGMLIRSAGEAGIAYRWQVYVLGGIATVAVLAWFARLPFAESSKVTLPATISCKAEEPAECCA
jgi:sodium transport system permease protein